MKSIVLVGLSGCVVSFLAGCGGLSVRVQTPAAIRAESDTYAGLVTNGKASADADDTPYYQLRREQNTVEGPQGISALRGLFGGK